VCVLLPYISYHYPMALTSWALLLIAISAGNALVVPRKTTWLPERGSILQEPMRTPTLTNDHNISPASHELRLSHEQNGMPAVLQLPRSGPDASHINDNLSIVDQQSHSNSVVQDNTHTGNMQTIEYPRLGGTTSHLHHIIIPWVDDVTLRNDRQSTDGLANGVRI
jgi:hypothetical protein